MPVSSSASYRAALYENQKRAQRNAANQQVLYPSPVPVHGQVTDSETSRKLTEGLGETENAR
jgi:hypothetical protein